MRAILKAFLTLVLCLPLSGCFFFLWIPGSVMDSMSDSLAGRGGDHCVADTVIVGQAIMLTDGTRAVVEKLHGLSARCPNAKFSVRALLKVEQRSEAF